MGNYAAFGFGRPRFGNWAAHGLGLTTFAPPAPEPTYPPDRTFIVVGDEAIPCIRVSDCGVGRLGLVPVGKSDPVRCPTGESIPVKGVGPVRVSRASASTGRGGEPIRVPRPRVRPVKKE